MSMNVIYARNTDFDYPEANKVQVINMCRAFAQCGCNLTLIAFGKNHDKFREKYAVNDQFQSKLIKYKIRFFIFGELALFLQFLKYRKKAQLIYCRDIIFAFLVKFFYPEKKVCLEIHDIPKKSWRRWLLKKYLPRIDLAIVISQGLKDAILKLGVRETNIIILHDAVNTDDINIPISRDKARLKLNLQLAKPIIAYVGSTKEDRDLDKFIEAARALPEINFVIFGKEKEFINKAAGNSKNLIFKGYAENPALAYRAADILFAGYSKKVPTINYMSPLKIFEYMAADRPIIVADFPRTREILTEDEAYFYESENSGSIVEMIKEITTNKNEAQNKAAKAFEKAKKYTWGNRARKIISLLTI